MISFFSKHRRVVYIGVGIIFIGSIFFVSGEVFTSQADSVAEVGGKKISYQQFQVQVNHVMANVKDSGAEVNDILSRTDKQEVFREMIVEELLSQQAAEMGMRVSDFEVAVEVQNTPQFREGGGFSPRAYYQTIFNEFQMSPAEYEAWRKKARLASKLKQFIYTSVKVTPAEVRAFYLASGKPLRDFEAQKAKVADELARAKFAEIANYMLRQLTTRNEVRSYLEAREQGR